MRFFSGTPSDPQPSLGLVIGGPLSLQSLRTEARISRQ